MTMPDWFVGLAKCIGERRERMNCRNPEPLWHAGYEAALDEMLLAMELEVLTPYITQGMPREPGHEVMRPHNDTGV